MIVQYSRLSLAVVGLGLAITTSAKPIAAPQLDTASVTALKNAIKKDHGHVVVINFWATWCGPCMAEFPDLVKTYDELKPKGMDLITISGDSFADKMRAATVIKLRHAPYPAYIKPKGDIVAYAKSLDPKWDGSLPRTFILDRSGNVKYTIAGRFDDAVLRKDIQTLLAQHAVGKPKPAHTLLGG